MFRAIWEFAQSADCVAQTEDPQNACQSVDCAILIAQTVEPCRLARILWIFSLRNAICRLHGTYILYNYIHVYTCIYMYIHSCVIHVRFLIVFSTSPKHSFINCVIIHVHSKKPRWILYMYYIVYCTALYSTVQYSTVYYCTAPHCTVHCTVHCTLLYIVLYTVLYTALYTAVLYTVLYTVLYCILYTALYCTLYYTVYCTVLYYTVLYCTVNALQYYHL